MWFSFTFLSLFLSVFFCFCTCHAVRGKSLQPDCEMMSQIHKTLTSSFQLYLLFIIHISFSFERTCTCVCKPTRVGVPFVVCVSVVVPAVHCLCMELYDSYTLRLTNLMVHVCKLWDGNLFPHIWLGTKVSVADHFCSTIWAFCTYSFHYFSTFWSGLLIGLSLLPASPLIQLILRLVF